MEKGMMKFNEWDIPLILDSYEDIFTDFDPRSYSQKALSEDFLSECRKASNDKKRVDLKLFVPKNKRKLSDEIKIKRRLKEHFKKHTKDKRKEIGRINVNGFIWFWIGVVMIVLTAIFGSSNSNFLLNLVIVIAHPAGWFFMWEGLAKMLITSKDKKLDYIFHKKMANADIYFFSY